MSFSENRGTYGTFLVVFELLKKYGKKILFKKMFENFIRNILHKKIWIYNVKRIHNAQNHDLVHIDANHPLLDK